VKKLPPMLEPIIIMGKGRRRMLLTRALIAADISLLMVIREAAAVGLKTCFPKDRFDAAIHLKVDR
jgi:hypothetical protein